MLGVSASPDIQAAPSGSSQLPSKGRGISESAVTTKQAFNNPVAGQSLSQAPSQAPSQYSEASSALSSDSSSANSASHSSIKHNAALNSTESLNLSSHLSTSAASVTIGGNSSRLVIDSSSAESAVYSLNLGPLTISGLINANPSSSTTGSELGLVGGNAQSHFIQDPFADESQQNYFASQTEVKEQNGVKPQSPNKEDKQNEEDEPPVIFTHNLKPVDEGDEQDSEAQAAIEKQILAELSSRDSEVKAHEQAHSTVGGHLAQSPKFTYEQGSDGRRYAVDGEVQIDISAVPGDPLATVNKMKQVYAAAMAPTNPSMADIRVASEALKKLNEAKAELVELRQEKAFTPSEMAPLIGADNAIKGVVFPEPHRPIVSGEVNENGTISPHLVDSPSAIDDIDQLTPTVEQINKQLQHSVAADKPVISHEVLTFSSEVIAQRYSA